MDTIPSETDQDDSGASKRKPRSVVRKVVPEHNESEDDIDKSVNMVLNNEAAFERVMKNCMPAFFQMSQQMMGKNQ